MHSHHLFLECYYEPGIMLISEILRGKTESLLSRNKHLQRSKEAISMYCEGDLGVHKEK